MTFWEGEKNKKPERWSFDKGFVDPKWDWFWRDLAFFVPIWELGSAALYDLVTRKRGTIQSATTWKATDRGTALNFIDNASDGAIFTGPFIATDLGDFTGSFTVFSLARTPDVGADRHTMYAQWDSGTITGQMLFGMNMTRAAGTEAGTLGLTCHENITGFDGADSAAGLLLANTWYAMTGRRIWNGASSDVSVWLDGVDVTDAFETTNPRTARATSASYIGNYSTTIPFDGDISYVAGWNRPLSNGEVIQLSRDPFGPFRMDAQDELQLLGVAAAGGANPHGPLGHPLWGPLAGPVVA